MSTISYTTRFYGFQVLCDWRKDNVLLYKLLELDEAWNGKGQVVGIESNY